MRECVCLCVSDARISSLFKNAIDELESNNYSSMLGGKFSNHNKPLHQVPPTEEELKRELKLMEKQPGTILPRALAQEKRRMLFMSVPEQGELDLNLVKDSVYFFS